MMIMFQIVEEIAHADIDILTSKRFSVNSVMSPGSLGLVPPRSPTKSDDNGTGSGSNAR